MVIHSQQIYTLQSDDVVFDQRSGVISRITDLGTQRITDQELLIPNALDNFPITKIGALVFSSLGIKSLILSSKSLVEIAESAFQDNEIKKVIFNHSPKIIGENAFSNNKIEEIQFTKHSKLEEIKRGAFSHNALKCVDLKVCKNLCCIEADCFSHNQDHITLYAEPLVKFEIKDKHLYKQ